MERLNSLNNFDPSVAKVSKQDTEISDKLRKEFMKYPLTKADSFVLNRFISKNVSNNYSGLKRGPITSIKSPPFDLKNLPSYMDGY